MAKTISHPSIPPPSWSSPWRGPTPAVRRIGRWGELGLILFAIIIDLPPIHLTHCSDGRHLPRGVLQRLGDGPGPAGQRRGHDVRIPPNMFAIQCVVNYLLVPARPNMHVPHVNIGAPGGCGA